MESRERVISIVLSEQEWQSFVQAHPQPVEWIRQQILRESHLTARPDPGRGAATAVKFASVAGAASTTSATTR